MPRGYCTAFEKPIVSQISFRNMGQQGIVDLTDRGFGDGLALPPECENIDRAVIVFVLMPAVLCERTLLPAWSGNGLWALTGP